MSKAETSIKIANSCRSTFLMLFLLIIAFSAIVFIEAKENSNNIRKFNQKFNLGRIWYIIKDERISNWHRACNSISYNMDIKLTKDYSFEDGEWSELIKLTINNTLRNKLIGKLNFDNHFKSNSSQLRWDSRKREQSFTKFNWVKSDADFTSWSAQVPLQAKRPKLISDKLAQQISAEALLSASEVSTFESDSSWTEKIKIRKRVKFLLN